MPPAVSWCEAPLAPSLRELLSEREAEGVFFVCCSRLMVSAAPVGEALMPPASGAAARRLTEVSGSLNGNCQNLLSSWLPPGGSWIFWQSALRNRLAKKTDETNYEKSSPNL